MKLQTIALGLTLAAAGSAFAATTRDVTVVRNTPHGVVTTQKHIVRTNDRDDMVRHRHHVKKVVIVHPAHRYNRHVTVMHPAYHGSHVVNRTVVIHRDHPGYAVNRTVVVRHRG